MDNLSNTDENEDSEEKPSYLLYNARYVRSRHKKELFNSVESSGINQ